MTASIAKLFRWNSLPMQFGIVGVMLLGLTGCYTQLATVEHRTSRYDEPDYVEVEEHEDHVVVHNYYDTDPYYEDVYRPTTYRRYFSRYYSRPFYDSYFWDPYYSSFHVGFYANPHYYWDPYYDPYAAFHIGFYFGPFYADRYWSRPYHYGWAPRYAYSRLGYYGGWRYDSPYVIIRDTRDYEPRRATIGRGDVRSRDGRTVIREGGVRGTTGRSTQTVTGVVRTTTVGHPATHTAALAIMVVGDTIHPMLSSATPAIMSPAGRRSAGETFAAATVGRSYVRAVCVVRRAVRRSGGMRLRGVRYAVKQGDRQLAERWVDPPVRRLGVRPAEARSREVRRIRFAVPPPEVRALKHHRRALRLHRRDRRVRRLGQALRPHDPVRRSPRGAVLREETMIRPTRS